MKNFAQRGNSFSILIILAAAGIIFFLILVNALQFKDRLFNSLYPKPNSFASSGSSPVGNEVKFDQVQVKDTTDTSATVTWETNIPSTSRLIVGLYVDVLSLPTMEDTTLSVDHEVTITGLVSKTTYYYKVMSRNANDQEFSSEIKQLETK